MTRKRPREAAWQLRASLVPRIADITVPDKIVSLLCVVRDISSVETVTTRLNEELRKRDISVADHSHGLFRVTLWGAAATSWPLCEDDLCVLENVGSREFQRRISVSSRRDSALHVLRRGGNLFQGGCRGAGNRSCRLTASRASGPILCSSRRGSITSSGAD